jgi:hypothetical protein
VKDERLDDLQAMGASPADIELILQINSLKTEPTDYEVLPENWQTVMLFLACQTQWRTGGMGGVVGLDYNVVFKMMQVYKIEDEKQQLEDLQIMEGAVLSKIAKRRK